MANVIWDLIVVGSGPSGGRIAHALTKQGARVLLLEAGRYFKTKDFPKSELISSAQMFWGGGIELSHDARLGFLRAKCVGGTSIVNQALLDRFDDLVWDEWSSLSGIKFSATEMDSLYEQVESSMSIQHLEQKNFNRNTTLFTQAFESKNLKWDPLRRGQKDCALDRGNDCMACLGGCPRASKQSSMVTSVEPALELGLTLKANCEVESIHENGDQVEVNAFENGKQQKFLSRAVVLAAGSFGTTKILLQSEFAIRLPALGQNVSCHPQYMTYSFFNEPVDSFRGAFQAVKSSDSFLRKSGIKFENVFAPPIATAMLFDGFGKTHHKMMEKYRYLASMEVAIRDEAVGRITVSKGKLTVVKKLTSQDQSRAKLGLDLVEEMYRNVGAKELIKCTQGFGLHLMGGCAIGNNPSSSVVDPDFKVHGSKRTFIADSSIFPSAPGINPSLSIMALSQKAIPSIARGCR